MSDKSKNAPGEDDDFGFIETDDADDADFAFENMPDAPSSGGSADAYGFADEDDFPTSHHGTTPDADADVDSDDEGFADDSDDDAAAIPKPDPSVNMRTRRAEVDETEADANLFGDLDADGGEDDADDDEEEETASGAAAGGSKGRIIFYAAAAAAVLGIGFVGYNFVLPQTGLMGPLTASVEPAVGSFDDVVPKPGFALADAGIPGGALPLDGMPGTLPVSLPADTAGALEDPSSQPVDAQVSKVGAALALPDAAPASLETSPSVVPTVGDAGAPSSIEAVALRKEVEELVRDREAMRDKLDALEKRFASLEKSMPDTAPLPMVEPPAKPPVVENWTLKGVLKGVAWIDGPTGFREVRSGDAVEGVGTVKDITRYENAWVVVTTKGVILQGE